jgi:hypothetical protein
MGNHLTPVLSRVDVRALIAVITTAVEDERSLSVGGAFWIISLDMSSEFGPLSGSNIWTYDEGTNTNLEQTAQPGDSLLVLFTIRYWRE